MDLVLERYTFGAIGIPSPSLRKSIDSRLLTTSTEPIRLQLIAGAGKGTARNGIEGEY